MLAAYRYIELRLVATVAANYDQNSGSDAVTEADLTTLLGKVIIDEKLARSFEHNVRAASKMKDLAGSIMLRVGAGPTMQAAFQSRSRSGLFAMVVQCSFLAWLHENDTLAAAFVAHYQRIALASPSEEAPSYPDQDHIHSVLRACQEQSAAFDWEQRVYAAADRLGFVYEVGGMRYPERWFATLPIDKAIFQALIEFLPLVSRFREKYSIVIRSNREVKQIGICAIAVWVHDILGLNMEVRFVERGKTVNFHQPYSSSAECSVSILIGEDKAVLDKQPHAVLFSASEHSVGEVFTIRRMDEDVQLKSLPLERAYGSGAHAFLAFRHCSEALIKELVLMTCGYALYVADWLRYGDARDEKDVPVGGRTNLPVLITETVLCKAATYLFEYLPTVAATELTYESMQDRKAPTPMLDEVPPILAELKFSRQERYWKEFRRIIIEQAAMLLAFCHVVDLDNCKEFSFIGCREPPSFAKVLKEWDHKSPLVVSADTWFVSVVQQFDQDPDHHPAYLLAACGKSLVCRSGWSVYVNTIDLLDPGRLLVGGICIQAGVPVCDGIVKHKTVDDDRGALVQELVEGSCRYDADVNFSECIISTKFLWVSYPVDSIRDGLLTAAIAESILLVRWTVSLCSYGCSTLLQMIHITRTSRQRGTKSCSTAYSGSAQPRVVHTC